MYRSLGCFHTLQPQSNPFAAPTLPALTPEGFVRWQSIQLLLDPDKHVPLLQEAVKRFEIRRPDGGEPFPRLLPEEALPLEADDDLLAWHNNVLENLRHCPPTRPNGASQGDSGSPRVSDEVQSINDSSTDDSSFVDASDYFQPQRKGIPRASPHVIPPSPETDRYVPTHESRNLAEREERKRSKSDQRSISDEPWFSDGPTPTTSAPPAQARPSQLSRSYTTRTPRTQSPYDSDGRQTNTSTARERFQPLDRSSRSGARLSPFLDTQSRRHSASNVHDRRHLGVQNELPQSRTLSPPFYARPNPSDLPNEILLSRPQSAVRFETPSYEPRRSRTASRPERSGSTRYDSSSSSGSDVEGLSARQRRSFSKTRDEHQHTTRRAERR